MSEVALSSVLDPLPNQISLGVLPYYHIYGELQRSVFTDAAADTSIS